LALTAEGIESLGAIARSRGEAARRWSGRKCCLRTERDPRSLRSGKGSACIITLFNAASGAGLSAKGRRVHRRPRLGWCRWFATTPMINISPLECWDQILLYAIHGSFDQHRRHNASVMQASDKRQPLPLPVQLGNPDSLQSGRAVTRCFRNRRQPISNPL
jgi:hypothetical protein